VTSSSFVHHATSRHANPTSRKASSRGTDTMVLSATKEIGQLLDSRGQIFHTVLEQVSLYKKKAMIREAKLMSSQ
jgi:hypothetical protein